MGFLKLPLVATEGFFFSLKFTIVITDGFFLKFILVFTGGIFFLLRFTLVMDIGLCIYGHFFIKVFCWRDKKIQFLLGNTVQ